MLDAHVDHVPMKERLEFVTIVCSKLFDPEGQMIHNMVYEGDGILLGMLAIDFEYPNPCRIIYG